MSSAARSRCSPCVQSLSLEDAKTLALQVLRQVMEEKLECHNVEVGVVTVEEKAFRHLTVEEIEKLIVGLKPLEDEDK